MQCENGSRNYGQHSTTTETVFIFVVGHMTRLHSMTMLRFCTRHYNIIVSLSSV